MKLESTDNDERGFAIIVTSLMGAIVFWKWAVIFWDKEET